MPSPSAPLPPRSVGALRALVLLVVLGSVAPFARIVVDWVSIARVLGEVPAALPRRGYDGVRWEDDGGIVAAYVAPRSPAEHAGLRTGDALFALDGQQFFSAADVQRAVERASGAEIVYDVVPAAAAARGEPAAPTPVPVRVARYPAFLYPLNAALWAASGWGFAVAAFLHALALAIVAPLMRRSRRAAHSAVLIGAALVWVGGNLLRLLLVAAVGPPEQVSPLLAGVFEGLTLVALSGWVLFPALLLRYVLLDAPAVRHATRAVRPAVWAPPVLLGGAMATAVLLGGLGPIPPDALLAPILFYVCVYVGAATALVLGAPTVRASLDAAHPAPGWSRAGSAVVLALAALGALFAWGGLPGMNDDDRVAEWLVVALQLFSVAPVVLLSLASLRYGRFDRVLSRAVSYVGTIGATFFGVAVGLWALRAVAPEGARSPLVVAAWLVGGLVVLERATARLRPALLRRVQTERQRARQRLNRFSDRVRTYLDAGTLAADAVAVVGEAMDARSAVLFLREPADPRRWVRAAFHPEPPHFTEEELEHVWAAMERDGRVWARIAELNESALPEAEAERLRRIGVALAVPVTSGRGEPVGALVLARKANRRAVYNLEDVEMLRALCAQLALAVERLALIEREKALERETAEAQLAALRAQINPHFLFNALNTIAALIAARPAEAEATVERLARLFRHVLTTGARAFVPLADEARLVREYLAIERARFGENLAVEEDWDPATLATPVPAFAVQTLVENAVKHGIERKRGGGRVRVGSRRLTDGAVEITVADTGAGIPALVGGALPDEGGDGQADDAPPAFFGIGLRNVAGRLAQLYGRRDLLRHAPAPGGGTEVRLLIPAEPVPEADQAPGAR